MSSEILGRPSRTPKRSARAIKIKDLLGPDAPDAYIQNANADDKPWYLRAEHGPEEIWLNPEGGVRGGTLPALIERLTSHDNRGMIDTIIRRWGLNACLQIMVLIARSC